MRPTPARSATSSDPSARILPVSLAAPPGGARMIAAEPRQARAAAMAPSAPVDAPLVDSHSHVYTTDMPLPATAWHKPPADATTEQLIETLDGHGVSFGVIA